MSVVTLIEPPRLAPIFARALTTGARRHGEALPDVTYQLAPQHIDPQRLARYARVCGLGYGDVVPATYPHILAFPVSMALMGRPDFPFPLVGTLHIANSITVHRPVRVGDELSLTMRADDLRPHRAGRQFDLHVEAFAGDERVWSERVTYLRRGADRNREDRNSEDRDREDRNREDRDREDRNSRGGRAGGADAGRRSPRAPSASPAGNAEIVRVPADLGRRYAAVSGDRNPIHLYPLTAKAFGMPGTIAHGMWQAARALARVESRLPASYVFDVAFKTPLPLPSTVAITTAATDGGWDLDIRNAKSGRPHLAGTIRPF